MKIALEFLNFVGAYQIPTKGRLIIDRRLSKLSSIKKFKTISWPPNIVKERELFQNASLPENPNHWNDFDGPISNQVPNLLFNPRTGLYEAMNIDGHQFAVIKRRSFASFTICNCHRNIIQLIISSVILSSGSSVRGSELNQTRRWKPLKLSTWN